MRALAVSTALLHVVLCGIAAFLMFFFATFPWENQTPESAAADDWLVGAAAVILALALAFGVGVIARWIPVMAVALLAQFILGWVVIDYALGESDKSDGVLLLYALAAAATALVAANAATRAEP